MALSRQQKKDLVALYGDGMAVAPHAFLVDYKGISVPEDTDLRHKIRESGGTYLVVKNTLAKLAVDGKGLEPLADHFTGPTAVAYTEGDVVALAKTLTEFAKAVPAVEFKAGIVEGRAIEANQIGDIASLPSREELLAKLLFLMQSPVTRLARGLAAITRDFVVTLDQVRQQKDAQS